MWLINAGYLAVHLPQNNQNPKLHLLEESSCAQYCNIRKKNCQ